MIDFYDCDNVETCVSNSSDERLDVFISDNFSITRSRATSLISDGYVVVNGNFKKKNYRVLKDDVVEVAFPAPVELNISKENIPLSLTAFICMSVAVCQDKNFSFLYKLRLIN